MSQKPSLCVSIYNLNLGCVLFLLISVQLVACSTFTEWMATETPTFTPTFTLTSTFTPTLEPSATSTILPSSTPSSTSTLTHKPSNTSTLTLTVTRTPHENPGLMVTLGESIKSPWWPAIPAFSSDGKMIALASDKIRLWDVNTQDLIREFSRPYTNCYTENVSFSADNSLLAVSMYCLDYDDPGHLLIWDTQNGNLLHDWEQEFFKGTAKLEGVSNTSPATGFAFLPNGSQIAVANGNMIEIKDIKLDRDPVKFELGNDMYATDISISENGEMMYVFMDFDYFYTSNDIAKKYAVQIWNLKTMEIQQRIEYPEITGCCQLVGHPVEEMNLVGKFLTQIDYVIGTFEVMNLETGDTRKLAYRRGLGKNGARWI